MAIDAKISFCEQVAAALADRVTVEQMDAIRRAVMNVTDRFEMREIQAAGAETDDLLDCYLAAMLEDQPAHEEAVEPEVEGDRWNWWYVCGECHAAVIDGQKRCNGCGRPISWRKL